jgi:hypothetical protein
MFLHSSMKFLWPSEHVLLPWKLWQYGDVLVAVTTPISRKGGYRSNKKVIISSSRKVLWRFFTFTFFIRSVVWGRVWQTDRQTNRWTDVWHILSLVGDFMQSHNTFLLLHIIKNWTECFVTWLSVTRDKLWIGNRIYWILNTCKYKQLRQSYWGTHSKDYCNYRTLKKSSQSSLTVAW